MNILVCVKRVPATGAKILLTENAQEIDTRHLAFTISPHEECGVEEAVRLVETHGGSATVLTLGPREASEQLRRALAMGMNRAVLLETDGGDWDPQATAASIVEAIHAQNEAGMAFDILFFGNEAADSGGYQVGIRQNLTPGGGSRMLACGYNTRLAASLRSGRTDRGAGCARPVHRLRNLRSNPASRRHGQQQDHRRHQ